MITTLSRSSSTQFPLLTLTKKKKGGEEGGPDSQPANAGLLLRCLESLTLRAAAVGWS